MRNILAVILIIISVSACGGKNTKPNIPPPLEFVVVDPEPIPVLDLNEVEWGVWNQSRLAQESVNSENKDKVFFVLTQEQANDLFENLNDISDAFAKSIAINKYWQKAVDDYRKKVAASKEEK